MQKYKNVICNGCNQKLQLMNQKELPKSRIFNYNETIQHWEEKL